MMRMPFPSFTRVPTVSSALLLPALVLLSSLLQVAVGAPSSSSASNDRHHSSDMDSNVVVVPPLPLIDAARVVIMDVVQSMSVEFTFALVFVASFLASRYLRAQSIPSGPVSSSPLGTPSEQSSAKPSPLTAPIRICPEEELIDSPQSPEVLKGVVRVTPLSPVAEEADDETPSRPLDEIRAISELTGARYTAAVAAYCKLRDSGALLKILTEPSSSTASPEDIKEAVTGMFGALAVATVRVGSKTPVTSFTIKRCLKDMNTFGIDISDDLVMSITKIATSKHHYRECLSLHRDLLEGELRRRPSTDKTVNSCLLFCSVEAEDYSECEKFARRIVASGEVPAPKDFANMMKYYFAVGKTDEGLKLLEVMRSKEIVPDVVTCNTLISSCVNARRMDIAETILRELMKTGEDLGHSVADVVTFNTVMKGYSRQGNVAKCDELMQVLKDKEIQPTVVTYGILLDCCINGDDMKRAQKVFEDMRAAQSNDVDSTPVTDKRHLGLNTVMYTTLIKGYAKEGNAKAAMEVFTEMRKSGVVPDLITFSILIKSNCDAGRLDISLKLLNDLLAEGYKPDEIIYNNLLYGCCIPLKDLETTIPSRKSLADQILLGMMDNHVEASSATFSIYMKVLLATVGDEIERVGPSAANSHQLYERAFTRCLSLLDSEMEAVYGVIPELRLYTQLMQQTIRHRNGHMTLTVCSSMVSRHLRNLQPDQPQPTVPKGTANTRNPAPKNRVDKITQQTVETLLATAITFGLLDTGLQLLEMFIKFRVTTVSSVHAPLIMKLSGMLEKKRRGETYIEQMNNIVEAYSKNPSLLGSNSVVYHKESQRQQPSSSYHRGYSERYHRNERSSNYSGNGRQKKVESRTDLTGPLVLVAGATAAAAIAAYVYMRNRPNEKREVDGAKQINEDEMVEDPVKELEEFNDWFVDDMYDYEAISKAEQPEEEEEKEPLTKTLGLDEGLMALGMQSNIMYLPNASPGEIRYGEESHVAVENPDVDDVFRIERVSEEEEMRRYFSGMDSGQKIMRGHRRKEDGQKPPSESLTVLLLWCIAGYGGAMKSDSGRNNWALLVDTSRYWYNYRHVANTLSMYYQIKRLGIPDSNIILMLAEDIACNARNPAPGYVFNDPENHVNLYPPEVEVDYRGDEVSTDNFMRLLTGRHTPDTPRSKRLDTDADSYVLVYITGHSGTDFVKFQDWEEMTSHDIADAFQQMYTQKRYKKLLWLADTCHAATLHDRFYSPNMLCLSSSGPDENSYSYHADLSLGISVVDRFTYWVSKFLSSSVKDTRSTRTVRDLVDTLPWSKLHSHATLREDLYPSGASDTLLTEFLAATDQFMFVDSFINLTGRERNDSGVLPEVADAPRTFVQAEGEVKEGSLEQVDAHPAQLGAVSMRIRALLSVAIVAVGAAASAFLLMS
ncbi:hypothetical protein FOL47_007943 [Perkinsus chesapeaki]|uniref:GPI-anchor transamidase n=1 Tax=Perkinsus chesapeaki TaxID=330153 RepID=A0A7J6MUN9_PERCH|nr:hypothetical protein FOL47_007943 [Perkinsus chesapeaki]